MEQEKNKFELDIKYIKDVIEKVKIVKTKEEIWKILSDLICVYRHDLIYNMTAIFGDSRHIKNLLQDKKKGYDYEVIMIYLDRIIKMSEDTIDLTRLFSVVFEENGLNSLDSLVKDLDDDSLN